MTPPSTRAPILVLGIGNILLRDEGVGVHIVKAMESMPLPNGVELLDGGTAGADLLDAISDRDKLIVIDALDADVPPGTILRMKPGDLAVGAPEGISLHEWGISDTLRMASHLNCGPSDSILIAIKPRDIQCGLELSPEMNERVPHIIKAVLAEIMVQSQAGYSGTCAEDAGSRRLSGSQIHVTCVPIVNGKPVY